MGPKITACDLELMGPCAWEKLRLKSLQAAANPRHAAHCYYLEDLAGVQGCDCCLF